MLLARYHQIASSAEQLKHQYAKGSALFTPEELVLAARGLGLHATRQRPALARLPLLGLPALAFTRTGQALVLAQVAPATAEQPQARYLIQDPLVGRPEVLTESQFVERWSGELLLLASRASLLGQLARFDFSWFIPAVVKYRRLLGEVLLISFFLQLFALLTPLFFQVVMDKVLVHQAMTTLDVLVLGLVVLVIFESVLTALRTYVFSHTTSRIDVELGARLFRHLVQLPLAYFQARRVGDSVARVRELENIRSFLTGQALTLVLDVLFSVVFISVMFFYSVPLTLIVLASLPIYVLISASVVPTLRTRLDEKFARGAENQAFLVESVTGVQTLKAQALEPIMTKRWDEQLAGYVKASFKTTTLATFAHEAINLTGKLVNAALLWYGAQLVMTQALSLGEFIAFNMLAGRVAQPILRMAQLWTDFQQVGISMARLGDILNTPTEMTRTSQAQLPSLTGRISFEQVVFRYRPETAPVLKGITLDIAPGEVIGLVGRSGSGKSTLTKLVQRLYVPESGRVLVDGQDISLIDATQLRRQIGVVLQENFLFNRTVRDNIAITDPGAPLEQVVQVAQLAGAHEFIQELPEGYDTVVGEQGASLSGGQRQRIAIARALFTQPKILIFDEATSALDYESEAVIQSHMQQIAAGRTVLIIAHRLTAVRHAHRIVVLQQGELHEVGTHETLLSQPGGIYAHLWQLQQEGRV